MTRYEQGFLTKCAEYGVDAEKLYKMAFASHASNAELAEYLHDRNSRMAKKVPKLLRPLADPDSKINKFFDQLPSIYMSSTGRLLTQGEVKTRADTNPLAYLIHGRKAKKYIADKRRKELLELTKNLPAYTAPPQALLGQGGRLVRTSEGGLARERPILTMGGWQSKLPPDHPLYQPTKG